MWFCVEDEELYSGTSYNFLGSEPIISRHSHQSPLRTEYAIPWLNGKWVWKLAQTSYFLFVNITPTEFWVSCLGEEQLSDVSKRWILLSWHTLWVCPHACHQEIVCWNFRIFITTDDENNFRIYMFQLDTSGLFLTYLFILAVMQLNYDMVRDGMVLVLNLFLNWADHGSWHFKFPNFKIHWILWIFRSLRLCAKKDQNHDHCPNYMFCNTCCNGSFILVLQLISEVEERQPREGLPLHAH